MQILGWGKDLYTSLITARHICISLLTEVTAAHNVKSTILSRSNIWLDWHLTYIGVKYHWISPINAMTEISTRAIDAISAHDLADLLLRSEESAESFLAFLETCFKFDEQDLSNALRIWVYAFFIEIEQSDDSITVKLKKISDVWAMLNYPNSLADFIYFMPSESGDERSPAVIYQRFQDFLKSEELLLAKYSKSDAF